MQRWYDDQIFASLGINRWEDEKPLLRHTNINMWWPPHPPLQHSSPNKVNNFTQAWEAAGCSNFIHFFSFCLDMYIVLLYREGCSGFICDANLKTYSMDLFSGNSSCSIWQAAEWHCDAKLYLKVLFFAGEVSAYCCVHYRAEEG